MLDSSHKHPWEGRGPSHLGEEQIRSSQTHSMLQVSSNSPSSLTHHPVWILCRVFFITCQSVNRINTLPYSESDPREQRACSLLSGPHYLEHRLTALYLPNNTYLCPTTYPRHYSICRFNTETQSSQQPHKIGSMIPFCRWGCKGFAVKWFHSWYSAKAGIWTQVVWPRTCDPNSHVLLPLIVNHQHTVEDRKKNDKNGMKVSLRELKDKKISFSKLPIHSGVVTKQQTLSWPNSDIGYLS